MDLVTFVLFGGGRKNSQVIGNHPLPLTRRGLITMNGLFVKLCGYLNLQIVISGTRYIFLPHRVKTQYEDVGHFFFYFCTKRYCGSGSITWKKSKVSVIVVLIVDFLEKIKNPVCTKCTNSTIKSIAG